MGNLISFGIGYTANSTAATSVVIQPPQMYASGNLLVMGVIAGGTAAGVVPSLPAGWTRASASGATLATFYKTATASESPYTVSLASASCAAGFVAAYPASTVGAFSASNSGSDVTSFTSTFPGGVGAAQTVLMLSGAVANASDPNSNSGYQNVNLPATSGWTTDVPVFGPALPTNASNYLPCAIGLAEVTGSTSNPVLATPQGANLFSGYLLLTITGAAPSPYTVTATQADPFGAVGMALTVKALTGAAPASQIITGGATATRGANGASLAPSLAITPNQTGSVIYGAACENYGVSGGSTFTALSGTTFSQNVGDAVNDAIYGTLQSSGTVTRATPVTLGGSAPVNSWWNIALAEIQPSGTIAESETATVHATMPGQYYTMANSQTAVFASTPPSGSLIVAMVSANSAWPNGHGATVTITDSLGLTWTQLASSAYTGYAGVFVAQFPVTTTITAASAGSGDWGDIALVYSGATAVGAAASVTGTGAGAVQLTTTASNSAVSVIVLDWNAVSGASRTWLTVNGITPTAGNGYELDYTLVGTNYGVYVAYYPDTGAAGAKTVGLSAPTGMKYTAVAIEAIGTATTAYTAALPVAFSMKSLPPWENAHATMAAKLTLAASSVGYRIMQANLNVGFSLAETYAVSANAELDIETDIAPSATGWIFTGPVALTYLQYLGLTGSLEVTPGEFAYYILPASGWSYPLNIPPADGRWESLGGTQVGGALHPETPAPLTSKIKRAGMKARSAYGEKGKKK